MSRQQFVNIPSLIDKVLLWIEAYESLLKGEEQHKLFQRSYEITRIKNKGLGLIGI